MAHPHCRFLPALALAAMLGASPTLLLAQHGHARPRLPMPVCDWLRADPVTDLSGSTEELLRLAEITGNIGPIGRGLRRPSDRLMDCADPGAGVQRHELGRWVTLGLVAPSIGTVHNSGYPEDRNNGGMWSGRGLSSQAAFGVRLSAGPLDAGFVPEVRWAQNRDYDLNSIDRPGFDPYANPYYNDIDLPQRFGEGAFSDLGPGQSYARLTGWNLSAGVSTENVWAGPAIRNPILLSNSAEGFPHFFMRTEAPVDAYLADVDVSVLLGFVEESEHFDSNRRNDDGRIGAWTVTARPRGLEELELGVARTFRYDPDHAPTGLLGPLGIDTGEEAGLGMLSLFGRFRLPESGADVWFEWARTAGFGSFADDLVTEPEHSQAFVAGFQKVSTSWFPIRIMAELAHLQEKQREREGRSLPIYYTHYAVRQGHTHRGQLLGAAIGPGGDAQYVEADWLFEGGFAGIFVERLRRNDASQFAIRERFDSYLHDTQLTLGVRGGYFFRGLLVDASASHSHRVMRDFIRDDDNLRLTLEMSWWP